jgi:hypothetical protein
MWQESCFWVGLGSRARAGHRRRGTARPLSEHPTGTDIVSVMTETPPPTTPSIPDGAKPKKLRRYSYRETVPSVDIEAAVDALIDDNGADWFADDENELAQQMRMVAGSIETPGWSLSCEPVWTDEPMWNDNLQMVTGETQAIEVGFYDRIHGAALTHQTVAADMFPGLIGTSGRARSGFWSPTS